MNRSHRTEGPSLPLSSRTHIWEVLSWNHSIVKGGKIKTVGKQLVLWPQGCHTLFVLLW